MSGSVRRVARLGAVLLAASLLWACEGDDGAAGPPGPEGPAGPQGPPGTPGSGGGAVPIESADRINIEVTNIAIPSGGGAPVVDMTLTNDLTQGLKGLTAGEIRLILAQLSPPPPGSGESSEWQSYTTRAAGQQATTETATAGTFVDNGDGTYQYTFAQALDDYEFGPTFDATKTHRIGIEIRGQAPISGNGVVTFLPTGGDPTFTRDIVDNNTCNACHDRLEFHGGPRTDVPYCVTCHNPYSIDPDTGNTVDMAPMIHNIHVGRDDYVIIGYGGTVYDYSDVEFTQDVRNCTTCHEESDPNTPDASNWREVANRVSCGTCHYDVDGPGDGDEDYAIEDGEHPGGFQFDDDSQCLNCHGPDSPLGLSTAEVHAIPSLEASNDFVFEVVDARNVTTGGFVEIDYRVTDAAGTPYDLDTAPEFGTCEFGSSGTSRLVLLIGWTTDDYTNQDSGVENAEPISMNALTACGSTATDPDGDLTYTITSPTAIPAGLGGSQTLSVSLEGHPAGDLDGDGTFSDRIAVTNAIEYFGIDGADVVERRNAVNIQRCNACHLQLSIHGNNRTDEPEVCVVCHNPNATDIPVRVAGTECDIGRPPGTNGPDDPGVIGLGLDDETIDMKVMIHRIHAGNIGICGFRSSSHPYFDVVYPGALNNCEGCHEPNSYYPVEAGAILGTTVDSNDPTTPTDDVVISANSAVCAGCHTSETARQHMIQNGGDFNATKAADSTLISSGVETCVLCHGPGGSSDVSEVHGVDTYEFNEVTTSD